MTGHCAATRPALPDARKAEGFVGSRAGEAFGRKHTEDLSGPGTTQTAFRASPDLTHNQPQGRGNPAEFVPKATVSVCSKEGSLLLWQREHLG